MEQCWNEPGKAHRTSRLNSWAHLPGSKCPKFGPKRTKKWPHMAEIALWPHKLAHSAILGLNWWERLEHNMGHTEIPVGAFFQG